MITNLIVIIHTIVCFVLILVILLQAGRGSGLSWGSFSGNPQSFFGTKSATVLAKATSVSAIIFLFTCITLNVVETKKAKSLFSGPKPSQVDVEKIKQVLDDMKVKEGADANAVPVTAGAVPTNPTSTPGVAAEEAAKKAAPTP